MYFHIKNILIGNPWMSLIFLSRPVQSVKVTIIIGSYCSFAISINIYLKSLFDTNKWNIEYKYLLIDLLLKLICSWPILFFKIFTDSE